MTARPNVIYILGDDQRGDHLRCVGDATLQTPHIDQLGHRDFARGLGP